MSTVPAFAFRGMKPVISDKLISDQQAVEAVNTDLITGNVRSYLSPLFDASLGKSGEIKTLFEIDDGIWCHWNEEVDVARMPIANNSTNRIAFTGTDQPRVTDQILAQQGGGVNYPEVSYALGLPQPDKILDIDIYTEPPVGTQLNWDIAGTAGDQVGNRIARVYTYTFINQFGEESPPADPSQIAYTSDDECVDLTNFAGTPTGPYLIERVRIYRSIAGVGTSLYLLVDEVPFPVVEPYRDCKTDTELGEALASTTWSAPPTGLRGITAMANGMLAGFLDNTVYFSEPYQGHAWPEDYTRSVDFPVLGLVSSGNMLFIMTEGYPYVAVGNHPEVISLNKLERSQACVSSRSIADMGQGGIYASSDGLVGITTGGTQLVSEGVFDKRIWSLLNPLDIHGYYYKDKYFGFYKDADPIGFGKNIPVDGGFIYDMQNKDVVFTDQYATAAYFDQVDGRLYFVTEDTNEVFAWDANTATKLTHRWRGKVTEGRRTNFTAARVQAQAYPVTFRCWSNGKLDSERVVSNRRPFRLPAGFTRRDWQIEVEGTEVIEGVFFADTMEELW